MRKLTATYIFPVNEPPIKHGIIICDSDGTIREIINRDGHIHEESGLEHYNGILTPGFVNAHCHLELFNLKNKIEEKKGIGHFIGKINQLRNHETGEIERAMSLADKKMWANGIVGLGDISKSAYSIETKRKIKILYHTFVETFGFVPERAERAFNYALKVQKEFILNKLHASVVPHSPYSVSDVLFDLLKKYAEIEKNILSIHSLESQAEIQFFDDGCGTIMEHLKDNLNLDVSHWKATGKNPILAILKYLPPQNSLLLVHNTYLNKHVINELKKQRSMDNTFFVLCPNSNLYIENQIPPVSLMRNNELTICLGTDSLASNRELSVLSEMKTIQQHFPEIKLEELIRWSCFNGALALNANRKLGSFEKGKQPGINLISGIDFKHMKLTPESRVKRLL